MGIFGKCILSDSLHQHSQSQEWAAYHLLTSVTRAGAPLGVHLQEEWEKMGAERTSDSEEPPIPSPWLPAALMQTSHACFHNCDFLIHTWPLEKWKSSVTVSSIWFKTPRSVPVLCCRCYEVPLEADVSELKMRKQ